MVEFGELLEKFAGYHLGDFSGGADVYTPMKEHCMIFKLNKRGNKNLITRVSEVRLESHKSIDVLYNPGIMTELFNASGILIKLLFIRIEVIVTKDTCSLALVAEKIYADFSTRDSVINENQMDDVFEQVCTV